MPAGLDLSQPRSDASAAAAAATAANITPGHGQPGAAGTLSGPGPVAPGSEQPERLDALNRIAVAGLGMRKHQHEEAAYLGNTATATAAAGGANKRPRTEGGGSVDEGEEISKADGGGMPSLTTS